jgi:hypothetical protein
MTQIGVKPLRSGETTLPVGGHPRKLAKLLACTTTTAPVILPVGGTGNAIPYAAYSLTNIGDDAVYYALGAAGITVAAASDGCDNVIAAGVTLTITNLAPTPATHIAGITATGTATLVIAGVV